MAMMTGLMILITVETMMAMITIFMNNDKGDDVENMLMTVVETRAQKEGAECNFAKMLMLLFVCVMAMLLPVMVMMLFDDIEARV